MVGIGVSVFVGLACSVIKSQVGNNNLEVRVTAKAVPVMRKSNGSGFETDIKIQGRIAIMEKITNKKLIRIIGRIFDNTATAP